MNKKNQIVLIIVALVILIGVGIIAWASYTGKIDLSAITKDYIR
jgi:hypothetical protein